MTDTKNPDDGGLAFPRKIKGKSCTGEDVAFYDSGLTKREYFAAMAMQGLIQWASSYLGKSEEKDTSITYKTYSDHTVFAIAAVRFADALIAELGKGEG